MIVTIFEMYLELFRRYANYLRSGRRRRSGRSPWGPQSQTEHAWRNKL